MENDSRNNEELIRLKGELKSATELVETLRKQIDILEKGDVENTNDAPQKVYDEDVLKLLEQQIKSFYPVPKKIVHPMLILTHPNQKCRLIATFNDVVDDDVTKMLINDMETWFLSLDEEMILDVSSLQTKYIEKLNEVSLKMKDSKTETSSYSSVLLSNGKTIVTRIGVSPIYLFDNGQIKLLEQRNKDEFESTVIDDNAYTTLILFSNGANESIQDDKIKIVTRLTSREELAEELLESTTNIPLAEIQSLL